MVLCVLVTSFLTFCTPHCRLLGPHILSCICPLAYALSSQPVNLDCDFLQGHANLGTGYLS